ncbi:MAG: hypothetical protein V4696_03865 [Pseudomonadota bacterium]
MSKTYLTVASHWSVPGIRQLASHTSDCADVNAISFVNDLLPDLRDWLRDDEEALAFVPSLTLHAGDDWRRVVAEMQFARLVGYDDGVDEAVARLQRHVEGSFSLQPFALPFNLDDEAARAALEDFVAEDDRYLPDSKIDFPMVWIEQVETVDVKPWNSAATYRDGQPLTMDGKAMIAHVVEQREEWSKRQAAGEMNETAGHEEADTVVAVLDEILVTAGVQPVMPAVTALEFNHDNGKALGLDLGELLSVISLATQFADDWLEHIEESERDEAAAARNTVDRVRASVLALWPALSGITNALESAEGALTGLASANERLISPSEFVHDDELIAATEEATEARHFIKGALDGIGRLTGTPEPVKIAVGIAGGCLTGASVDNHVYPVRLFIADFDQEGVDEKELVDLEDEDSASEALAGVWEETLSQDSAWVTRVEAGSVELSERQKGNR